MQKQTEKRQDFLINAFYYLVVGGIVFILFRYLFPYLMPFIIGFSIAFLLKPVSHWIADHSMLSRRVAGVVVLIVVYGIISVLLWLLGAKLFHSLQEFFAHSTEYFEEYLLPLLKRFGIVTVDTVATISTDLASGTESLVQGVISSIQAGINELSGKAISSLADIGGKIPEFGFSFGFCLMSSFFILMDYHKVTSFFVKQVPQRWRPVLFEMKRHCSETLGCYFRAYLILMLVTFIELSIGFWVIGVHNPIIVAGLVALLDALPLIGTGGILIPWILIEFIKGDYFLVIGLTIVYAIVTLVRNLMEPKVLGKQLGINPLLTLVAIYIGCKTMGVIGMIVFPMLLRVIINLHQSGSLHFWND